MNRDIKPANCNIIETSPNISIYSRSDLKEDGDLVEVTSSGSLGILIAKALFTTGACTMRRFFFCSWSQALKHDQ